MKFRFLIFKMEKHSREPLQELNEMRECMRSVEPMAGNKSEFWAPGWLCQYNVRLLISGS